LGAQAFHVGMVVRHVRDGWHGVICDWELSHAPHRSARQKRFQLPCYAVLVDAFSGGAQQRLGGNDSIVAYAAEHDLDRQTPATFQRGDKRLVHHTRVGELFTSFDGELGAYLLNEFCRYRYPDDRVVKPPAESITPIHAGQRTGERRPR
jgi:hemimethylated DNA binding protein